MPRFVFLLCLLFTLVACRPDEGAIALTVEQKVAAAVTATLSARPTATPYPTATAFPSSTAIPSFTPAATTTLLPTTTPYPTATPYPSFTPTATALPTNTPAPLPTHNPNAAAPPLPNSANVEISLIQDMTRMRNAANTIYEAVSAGIGRNVINCQIIIPAYDTIINSPTHDVTGTEDVVQSAYAVYRQVVTDLSANTSNIAILSQDCREPYNNGVAEISYGRQALQGLIFDLGEVKSALASALQSIGGS